MRDLRLVGYEDGVVIFESLEGEKYRVLADDALRAAMRQAAMAKPADLSITPREIQDRVRSGETIEALASQTGASAEFIEKFAQPVLDELRHIVQSALAIRITIAGDRFNDDVQEEFGTLITSRLTNNGASDLAWSSKRAEAGVWLVTVAYKLNGHEALAVWAFDPRKFHLSPENESAVALSNHNAPIDGPIAKLRTVAAPPSAPAPASAPVIAQRSDLSAPAAFRKPESADETPAAAKTPVADETPVVAKDEASTSILLDELRKRRETSATEVEVENEPEPSSELDFDLEPEDVQFSETGPLQAVPDLEETIDEGFVDDIEPDEPIDTDDIEPEVESGADVEPIADVEPVADVEETPAAASPKKGRAAMPSWDEIVFGTKTDEEI